MVKALHAGDHLLAVKLQVQTCRQVRDMVPFWCGKVVQEAPPNKRTTSEHSSILGKQSVCCYSAGCGPTCRQLHHLHMPSPADLQGDDLLQTQSAAVQRVGAQVRLGEVDGAMVGGLAPQRQGVQKRGGLRAHQVHRLGPRGHAQQVLVRVVVQAGACGPAGQWADACWWCQVRDGSKLCRSRRAGCNGACRMAGVAPCRQGWCALCCCTGGRQFLASVTVKGGVVDRQGCTACVSSTWACS